MVNANVKGARAENAVVDYLHVCGHEAERLRLAGTYDRGDLWVPSLNHRLEVKNHANILNALSEGTKDVEKLVALFPDATNAAVIARPGKGVRDWYYVRLMSHVFGLPQL
jgi:hypothetical protein